MAVAAFRESVWTDKPGAIAGATGGVSGTAAAQAHLRSILPVIGVALMGRPEIYFQSRPGAIDDDYTITDEKAALEPQYLGQVFDRLDWPVRRAASCGGRGDRAQDCVNSGFPGEEQGNLLFRLEHAVAAGERLVDGLAEGRELRFGRAVAGRVGREREEHVEWLGDAQAAGVLPLFDVAELGAEQFVGALK